MEENNDKVRIYYVFSKCVSENKGGSIVIIKERQNFCTMCGNK